MEVAWTQDGFRQIEAVVADPREKFLGCNADLQPGDLILFKFGRAFSHGAIVIDLPTIIHAVRKDREVVLGDLDRDVDLIGRPLMCFSFWAPGGGGNNGG